MEENSENENPCITACAPVSIPFGMGVVNQAYFQVKLNTLSSPTLIFQPTTLLLLAKLRAKCIFTSVYFFSLSWNPIDFRAANCQLFRFALYELAFVCVCVCVCAFGGIN